LAGIPPEVWADAALGGALIGRARGPRPTIRTPSASHEAVIPSDPFPTTTRPTSGRGRLLGEAETVPENASALNKFGIRMQNESLARMADARYDVVRDPTRTLGRDGTPLLTQEQLRNLGLNPQARPDALINRRVFDVYSPTSATAAGVHQGIADKVGAGQAHRVVVNLSGTDVTPSQLRQYLESSPITNLREIILIDRAGRVTNFYPF
jgi:hypothetical protein